MFDRRASSMTAPLPGYLTAGIHACRARTDRVALRPDYVRYQTHSTDVTWRPLDTERTGGDAWQLE